MASAKCFAYINIWNCICTRKFEREKMHLQCFLRTIRDNMQYGKDRKMAFKIEASMSLRTIKLRLKSPRKGLNCKQHRLNARRNDNQ